MAPGLLYPIACIPVNAGDTHHVDVESLINTQALLSPLYGSYRVEVTAFFSGISLYVPQLWHNGELRDLSSIANRSLDIGFPTYRLRGVAPFKTTTPLSSSHLLSYLGHGVGKMFLDKDTNHPEYVTDWNAVPLLMYFDIFRSYFANRQEEKYYRVTDAGSGNVELSTAPLNALDQLFADLPRTGGDITNQLGGFISNDLMNGVNCSKPLFGLVTTCFPKDRMTVFLNKDFVDANNLTSSVSVVNGTFQVDQLVTAKKLWDAGVKEQQISPTFKDWVRAHFGVTPKIMDDMPTFLGATYSDLYFEDIRATADSIYPDDEGNIVAGARLGDKGSSGKGYTRSRGFHCFADRPGYIMVLARLVPRPKYYQYDDRYTRYNSLSDLFKPEYNGIGLQDALVSDFNVDCSNAQSTENMDAEKINSVYMTAVAKQPAWLEYMTAVDKIRGTFCTTEKSWVLARDFNGPIGGGSSHYPVDMPFPTAYINPSDWNQPFAIRDLTAQNFLAQFYVKHTVRSSVAKRLLPWF